MTVPTATGDHAMTRRKLLGAYCARCGCAYLTPNWPGPGVCARCVTGIADFHHDIPLGFGWVSCG